jgi:hypothetical protein
MFARMKKTENGLILQISEGIVYLRAKILRGLRRYIPASVKTRLIHKRNEQLLSKFPHEFQVIEFSFIDYDDPHDLRWQWWSRIYEYELVLAQLKKLGADKSSKIHNTCWGFQGCHIEFKELLESMYPGTENSDLQASLLDNTAVYDVAWPCKRSWRNTFDFVINVSTVEEIADSHLLVVRNLLDMVRPGGFLIVTFDSPGLQLDEMCRLFGQEIRQVSNPLSALNSPAPDIVFGDLRAGYFVLRRN